LRELQYRLGYLREMQERRTAILKSIEEQGKLTPELRAAIEAAATKQDLEDLYLPFKPKRRTKGQIAREAGIEPLAELLFNDPQRVPLDEAQAYVLKDKTEAGDDFSTVQAVLDGVRDILSERWAEDAALVQSLRNWLWAEGLLASKLVAGKDENNPDHAKFRDYFDYDEPINRVPSHRALAVFRGRSLEILDAKLSLSEVLDAQGKPPAVSLAEGKIALHLGWSHKARPADDLIRKAVAWTWRVKLSLSLERDLFGRLREEAEKVAIKVFADNLRDLLLAAPAGPRCRCVSRAADRRDGRPVPPRSGRRGRGPCAAVSERVAERWECPARCLHRPGRRQVVTLRPRRPMSDAKAARQSRSRRGRPREALRRR
jgi:uncharacterized protein